MPPMIKRTTKRMNRTIEGNDALTMAIRSKIPKFDRPNLFRFITANTTSEQKTSIKTNNPSKANDGKATEILPKNKLEAINN